MFVKNPEYFLMIVKEHSISKAAERLGLIGDGADTAGPGK